MATTRIRDLPQISPSSSDAVLIDTGSQTGFALLDQLPISTLVQNALNLKADLTDLANYIPLSEKGAVNGVAELDGTGKVPLAQLPSFGATWGAITGTLSDQTDLQNALNTKLEAGDNVSDLTNDAGYLTSSALAGYATESWVNTQGFVKTLGDLGITSTASELNVLDGITATTTELNYTDGVTSSIQTQLNSKLENITGLITQGSNVTITGSGTTGSPYVINSTGGGTSPLTTKGDLYTYSTTDDRLPVGTNGQVLTADSSEATGLKWTSVGGSGTVTSVGMSVPTGLQVSGSPVTSSGTLAVTYDTGYQGYTTTEASKLSGIAAGATVGATWGTNLNSIPTIVSTLAGLSNASGVLTNNGSGTLSWTTPTTGTVTSVSGTANRITVTNGTTTPVINIATNYVGQNTITTLGTVTTGTWNGTAIGDSYISSASTWNAKQAAITGGATSITTSNLTASRALVSDGSGKVAVATTTATELGYVNGVTSAIQTQLNAKYGSGASPTFATVTTTGAIELGNASDTTIARTGAGAVAIEGKAVAVTDNAITLTNKRIQPRTNSSTSNANLTPDLSTANIWYRTTQTVGLTINAPTGTPVIGETIALYISAAGAQSITWNATYIAYGAALPTTTTAGKTLMVTAQFNGTNWATLTAEEQ